MYAYVHVGGLQKQCNATTVTHRLPSPVVWIPDLGAIEVVKIETLLAEASRGPLLALNNVVTAVIRCRFSRGWNRLRKFSQDLRPVWPKLTSELLVSENEIERWDDEKDAAHAINQTKQCFHSEHRIQIYCKGIVVQQPFGQIQCCFVSKITNMLCKKRGQADLCEILGSKRQSL